ncbi:MAG: hypothetical protein QOJ04_3185, partial [Caballeronia sp.]|nr:hypothetical protein [Caballeronia sp.]
WLGPLVSAGYVAVSAVLNPLASLLQ